MAGSPGKIYFLISATVGFIRINQNKIIKIISVVIVALLRPTLIASIYGMNFKAMPELTGRGLPVCAGVGADLGGRTVHLLPPRGGWLRYFRRSSVLQRELHDAGVAGREGRFAIAKVELPDAHEASVEAELAHG